MLTFNLDVSEQYGLDFFPPHQDASGPPVENVHPRLQTDLKAVKVVVEVVVEGSTATWKGANAALCWHSPCVFPTRRCW